MTLIIQKPTSSKLILAKTYVGIDDPDAAAYIAQVEAADEAASPGIGPLETATKVAIHSFFKGCKNDGIWPAIKAACILAGAKTRQGALVPLLATMPAPTSFNFVAGDYNRKLGLVGDGSTKYLNSNRAANSEPQDNTHLSIYAQPNFEAVTTNNLIGCNTVTFFVIQQASSQTRFLVNTPANDIPQISNPSPTFGGLYGVSRISSASILTRINQSNTSFSRTSVSVPTQNHFVFARNNSGNAINFSNARLAFYSIGESLNLELLDTRVTTLINAIGAAF